MLANAATVVSKNGPLVTQCEERFLLRHRRAGRAAGNIGRLLLPDYLMI